MAVIGPGAIQDNVAAPTPTLDGASEYEYVTLLNPLSDDFAIRVAQDIPVNMPIEIRSKTGLVNDQNDVTRNYGLNLKNPDFQARKHISNDTVIKAGGTINLKGNEAQVAVRQLMNEMMQRNGNKRLLADPTLRKELEDQIIIKRGSIQELMDGGIQSQRKQIDEALERSNEVNDESAAFPGLEQSTGTSQSPAGETTSPAPSDQESPRRVGRPKKTDS